MASFGPDYWRYMLLAASSVIVAFGMWWLAWSDNLEDGGIGFIGVALGLFLFGVAFLRPRGPAS